jgi:hypothetical protein
MQSDLVEYPISTYLPRDVVYFDGTSAVLPEDYVLNEGNLRLYVPKDKIEDVVNALRNSGFKDVVVLKLDKGEKFSLSMKIFNIWELHVRIYDDGFIDGHFEVSRDYFEHLNYQTVPSIYEVFDFYRTAYNKLHLYDSKVRKWVREVRTHYLVTLNPPKSLTSWEPIAVVAGLLSAIGIIAYALSRLEKGG